MAYNMSPLANEMGRFVFGEPVMIVGADVTHWARGMCVNDKKFFNVHVVPLTLRMLVRKSINIINDCVMPI